VSGGVVGGWGVGFWFWGGGLFFFKFWLSVFWGAGWGGGVVRN
jgi:hypothetical protein